MPSIDWNKLLKLLPVAAGIVNPAVGVAAGVIMSAAEKFLEDKEAEDPTFDRDVYLAEKQKEWEANIRAGEDLLNT